ncbi:MAG: VC0807 family protein [Verrucomicrobiota bacterium]
MPEQQHSITSGSKNPSIPAKPPVKKENTFLNLGFNLVLPILILNKGKKWFGSLLEPYFENVAVGILLIAIVFPVGYFIYDYYTRKKYNLFSILGLVSVLLTGGIGILNIPTEWFAIKEAAIPVLLGVAVIVSLKTPYPLIRTLLYNPEFIDVDKIQTALVERKSEALFEKLLVKCTLLIAGSFLISATLNYILAKWIVVSPSGTDAFNAEVGKMMAWSWPIIAVPGMAMMMLTLWILINGINKMTGLKLEEILHGAAEEKE